MAIASLLTTVAPCPFICTIIELFHLMACLFTEFHKCCVKILCFISSLINSCFTDSDGEGGGKEFHLKRETCSSCKKEISWIDKRAIEDCNDDNDLTVDDAEIVLEKLGMWSISEEEEAEEESMGWNWYDGKCRECRLLDGVSLLLETKDASVDELREAFSVFDRNGDGFITPMGVRSVMRRLGLEEGLRLEECRKMVEAFDEDGDGRICFFAFHQCYDRSIPINKSITSSSSPLSPPPRRRKKISPISLP